MRRGIKEILPAPGPGHGFGPEEYVLPLVMLLCGGGRTMEEMHEFELEEGSIGLCGFTRLRGAVAIGQGLRRSKRLKGLEQVNRFQGRLVFVRSERYDFTMDVDAGMVESKRQCADMIYLGCRAFQALLSLFAVLDLCVACDYRQGSVPAGWCVRR